MARTERMESLIETVDSFLGDYKEGTELKLLISPSEKCFLESYILHHPKGGINFYFQLGISKPGHLEHDYRLRKKI